MLLVWRISRKIVQVGYLLAFCAVGFCAAATASVLLNGALAPLPVLGAAGIGFGLFASAVRKRIVRIVGAATVLIVGQTAGSFYFAHQKELKKGDWEGVVRKGAQNPSTLLPKGIAPLAVNALHLQDKAAGQPADKAKPK